MGLRALDYLDGPSLVEQVRMSWRRGVNPRVYNPFLPVGFEEKHGLDRPLVINYHRRIELSDRTTGEGVLKVEDPPGSGAATWAVVCGAWRRPPSARWRAGTSTASASAA